MKRPPNSSATDFRNHVIARIMATEKTHPESRQFLAVGPGTRKNTLRFETELVFNDDTANQELAQYPLSWNVEQGNKVSFRSFSSRIVAGSLGRIRGVDAQTPNATFRYRDETATPAFWHENRIYFDQAGLLQNDHVPLTDWPESFSGPNAFARHVGGHWNIATWQENESPSLFNLDEVSP